MTSTYCCSSSSGNVAACWLGARAREGSRGYSDRGRLSRVYPWPFRRAARRATAEGVHGRRGEDFRRTRPGRTLEVETTRPCSRARTPRPLPVFADPPSQITCSAVWLSLHVAGCHNATPTSPRRFSLTLHFLSSWTRLASRLSPAQPCQNYYSSASASSPDNMGQHSQFGKLSIGRGRRTASPSSSHTLCQDVE